MLIITKNEMLFVLSVFKNPKTEYNANNIAKHLKISSMGALKIAKKLEYQKILISKKLGKAKFYKFNSNNEYARDYLKFLLKKEVQESHKYIKRWINEINKIKNASVCILFGSILTKHSEAKDIDVLLITNSKKFSKLKKEIEEINKINTKKLHPVYQTKEDIKKNIKKEDKPLLNAIKGIVVFGEDKIINLIEK